MPQTRRVSFSLLLCLGTAPFFSSPAPHHHLNVCAHFFFCFVFSFLTTTFFVVFTGTLAGVVAVVMVAALLLFLLPLPQLPLPPLLLLLLFVVGKGNTK